MNIVFYSSNINIFYDILTKQVCQSRRLNVGTLHYSDNCKFITITTQSNKTNPKKWVTQIPPQHRAWTHILAKGKQFLLFIRHPPCYSSSVLEGIHIQGELCSNGTFLFTPSVNKDIEYKLNILLFIPIHCTKYFILLPMCYFLLLNMLCHQMPYKLVRDKKTLINQVMRSTV
jgi:hypothetical protein